MLELQGFDSEGLKLLERACLEVLLRSSGPISGARLAQTLGIDEGTLQHDVEPELLARGLIEITSGGRKAAGEGPRYFKPSAGRRFVAALADGAELASDRRWLAS